MKAATVLTILSLTFSYSLLDLIVAVQASSQTPPTKKDGNGAEKPAANATQPHTEAGPQMADEIVFRSNTWLEVKNGYAWFGYGKNSPDTPLRFANPSFQPAPYGLSGILFGSFNGPEGQFYYGVYALQGTYTDKNGKRAETFTFTQSWASQAKYCGPNSPFADYCTPTVWEWTTQPSGCEDVSIFDPKDRSKPLLKIDTICKINTAYIPVPNTTWYLPRKGAVRFFMMDILMPVLDGVNKDGTPNIVDNVILDFDMQDIAQWATFNKMSGPVVENFSQPLWPLGFGLGYPGMGAVRMGAFHISPAQQTFWVV